MASLEEFFAGSRIVDSSTISEDMENVYFTGDSDRKQRGEITNNWYKQKPYAFVFTDRNDVKNTFYLPISPYNINIVTHFATNVISTMYGTVEEHSEQRYYDITISGTTGMAPRYYKVIEDQALDDSPVVGRAPTPIKSRLTGPFGGFMKRTQALIEATLNNASDLIGEDNSSTGIDLRRTGYTAFHNFYKFLLVYKKDASGELGNSSTRRRHPLKFVNYKDNNEYDVAVNNFQLTRDASDPMLYNYNISLRAYNLREADTQDISLDIASRAEELGVDGLTSSLFADLANKARQAKNTAYAVVALAKGFGS